MEREGRKQTREAEPVADDTEDIAQIKRMLTKQNSMVVGANLFGCVNLALICCVLGLVDTRGGATKDILLVDGNPVVRLNGHRQLEWLVGSRPQGCSQGLRLRPRCHGARRLR